MPIRVNFKRSLTDIAKNCLYWVCIRDSAEHGENCNFKKALSYAEYGVAFNQDGHEALNNWGTALHALGSHEDAIEKYSEALQIKPDKHEALNNWGSALHSLGRHEDAIEKYGEALQIKPDDHEALYNWGSALHALGRYDEAIEKLQQCKKMSGEPSYNLACVWSIQDKSDAALAELESCETAGNLPDLIDIIEDTDLDGLKAHKGFKALLKRLEDKG